MVHNMIMQMGPSRHCANIHYSLHISYIAFIMDLMFRKLLQFLKLSYTFLLSSVTWKVSLLVFYITFTTSFLHYFYTGLAVLKNSCNFQTSLIRFTVQYCLIDLVIMFFISCRLLKRQQLEPK